MKDRKLEIPQDIHQKSPIILAEPSEAELPYHQALATFCDEVNLHIRACELSSQVSLDENERLWLTGFAETAFLIDHVIGDDENNSQLASWATLYAINEAYAAKKIGKSICSPDQEPIRVEDGPFQHQMMRNIDYARETLMISEAGFMNITQFDAYLSDVIPLYILSKYLTSKQDHPRIEGELSEALFMKEFDQMARAMLISEQPDSVRGVENIRVRDTWSKLAVLTMDYWLRERAYPAFVFGNWVLNEITDSNNYPSRWRKSLDLKLDDFTKAIPTDSVVDFTVVPKGILGALQRVLKDGELYNQVDGVAGSKETDTRYRLQTLAVLVDRYLTGKPEPNDGEVLLHVFEGVNNLHDVYRARMIVKDESINMAVSAIVCEGNEVILYLARNVDGNPEKRIVTISLDNCKEVNPEGVIDQWVNESTELGAISIYTAAKIVTQINGVNSELQIMRLSDLEHNLASRRVYKSIVKQD